MRLPATFETEFRVKDNDRIEIVQLNFGEMMTVELTCQQFNELRKWVEQAIVAGDFSGPPSE